VVVCCQVRCDSGITEGSEISLFYDPMICKVCTLSFPLSTWCPVSVHSLCSIHSLFAQGPLCVHCVSTDSSIHQMFTQCLLSVLTGHPVSTEIGSVVYYRVIYLNRSVQTLMLIWHCQTSPAIHRLQLLPVCVYSILCASYHCKIWGLHRYS